MRIIFSLIFLFSCLSLFAQDNQEIDHIYCKDGSFIRGKILNFENEVYQIEMLGGSQITIEKKNVSSIKTKRLAKNRLFLNNGHNISTKEYYGIIALGNLTGKTSNYYNNYTTALSFHTIHGYQFDHNLFIGGGVGIDFYEYSTIPIFLDIRGYPLKKSISPFYALDIGYGFTSPLNEQYDWLTVNGGLMLNPNIGVRFASRQNLALQIAIGYKAQFISLDYPESNFTDEIVYNRFQFNLGLMF